MAGAWLYSLLPDGSGAGPAPACVARATLNIRPTLVQSLLERLLACTPTSSDPRHLARLLSSAKEHTSEEAPPATELIFTEQEEEEVDGPCGRTRVQSSSGQSWVEQYLVLERWSSGGAEAGTEELEQLHMEARRAAAPTPTPAPPTATWRAVRGWAGRCRSFVWRQEVKAEAEAEETVVVQARCVFVASSAAEARAAAQQGRVAASRFELVLRAASPRGLLQFLTLLLYHLPTAGTAGAAPRVGDGLPVLKRTLCGRALTLLHAMQHRWRADPALELEARILPLGTGGNGVRAGGAGLPEADFLEVCRRGGEAVRTATAAYHCDSFWAAPGRVRRRQFGGGGGGEGRPEEWRHLAVVQQLDLVPASAAVFSGGRTFGLRIALKAERPVEPGYRPLRAPETVRHVWRKSVAGLASGAALLELSQVTQTGEGDGADPDADPDAEKLSRYEVEVELVRATGPTGPTGPTEHTALAAWLGLVTFLATGSRYPAALCTPAAAVWSMAAV